MVLFLTQVVSCQATDDNLIVFFKTKSGEEHRVAVNKEVRERLILEFQDIGSHQNADLLTLRPTGISTAVSADGRALILRTSELGTIALSVSDDAIRLLQKHLAELAAIPQPTESKN